MKDDFYHEPVLLHEVIDLFGGFKGGVVVDGTVGGGGHLSGILTNNANITAIGIDRDEDALRYAEKRLSKFGNRVTLVKDSFSSMAKVISKQPHKEIIGVILDLGISSKQIDNSERGFSFSKEALLDMRMDKNIATNGYSIVNSSTKEDLEKIFREYGEETRSKKLAEAIVTERLKCPITSTTQLAGIIGRNIGGDNKTKARIFQAIRIEINREMDELEEVLQTAPHLLCSGGIMSVISYHSLEDRKVKIRFKEFTQYVNRGTYLFPNEKLPSPPPFRLITKKAILPTNEEIILNSRARSARMRAIEKK